MGHNCSRNTRVQSPTDSFNDSFNDGSTDRSNDSFNDGSTHGPVLEVCLDERLCIRSTTLEFIHRFCFSSTDDIIGQPFMTLLPPMVAEVYGQLPLPLDLHDLVESETQFSRNVTYVTVVTAAKEYLRVKPQFVYNETRHKVPVVVVRMIEMRPGRIAHPQIPIQRMQNLVNDRPCSPDARNTITLTNSVIIMFDMHNSTELVGAIPIQRVVEVYHTLYSIVSNELLRFEPFARLHETCGDSICLFFNSFGRVMMEPNILCRHSFTIAQRCLQRMNGHLSSVSGGKSFMRCGIAFGDVIGTVIDGRSFRVFGPCLHRAARLEGLGDRTALYMDAAFARRVRPLPDLEMQTKRVHLKGFEQAEEVCRVSTPDPEQKSSYHTERLTLPCKRGVSFERPE